MKQRVLETRLLWPMKRAYHVSVYYSDGTSESYFEPAHDLKIIRPIVLGEFIELK